MGGGPACARTARKSVGNLCWGVDASSTSRSTESVDVATGCGARLDAVGYLSVLGCIAGVFAARESTAQEKTFNQVDAQRVKPNMSAVFRGGAWAAAVRARLYVCVIACVENLKVARAEPARSDHSRRTSHPLAHRPTHLRSVRTCENLIPSESHS